MTNMWECHEFSRGGCWSCQPLPLIALARPMVCFVFAFPHFHSERRWRRPLASTVLWKLDSYTDMAFVFIARDCGSSLWWASLASIIFCTVFCQMIFNTCFALSDCDGELPESFGFVLLDFKLVNTAVRSVLPFDPDASDLPVAKPVTLKSSANLVGLEKVVGDVAQVCIQSLFLMSASAPHGFVLFSVVVGALNGSLSIALIVQDALQAEWAVQDRDLEQGTVLASLSGEKKILQEGSCSDMPKELPCERLEGGPSPESWVSGTYARYVDWLHDLYVVCTHSGLAQYPAVKKLFSIHCCSARMAYPPMEEMPGMGNGGHGMGNSIEVTVQTMSGRRNSFFMDKFGLIGDVKQRLSKEMGRRFHEMKLLCSGSNQEPDMFEKVSTFRGHRGTVDLTLVVNRTCRWCHAQITDRNTVNCKLDTEMGDFCSLRCYNLMGKELSDPHNVFNIFGLNADIPRDPRDMGHGGHHSHYQQMAQYDPWMDRRGGY
eukprot:s3391_g7.t2